MISLPKDGIYLMYLRKSRQDDPNETVEEVLQKHETRLQEFALKTLGYKIEEKNIYREIVSGETIDDRPKIKEIFRRLEQEDVTGVLVVNCSRLSRGDLVDCGTVIRCFLYTNTLIITDVKTFDPKDKFDRRMLEHELTSGNFYLEEAKTYMSTGRTESAKRGNFVGSIAPFGYERVKIEKSWTLKINEDQAQYVKLAFEMYANEGQGANAIAHRLNELGARSNNGKLFRSSVIRQMLTNEVYCGKITYKRKPSEKVMENGRIIKKRKRVKDYIVVEGKHTPIISQELFLKAQEQKGKVSRETPSHELQNVFAGLIKCKKCKMAIAMRVYRKDNVQFRKPRYYCRNGIYCDNTSANVDLVQGAIVQGLEELLTDFKLKLENQDKATQETSVSVIKALEKQLADFSKRQADICDYLEKGIYSVEMFIERKRKIDGEIERVQTALKKARDTVPTVEKYQEKILSLHQALETLNNEKISIKQKNNFLKEVIDVIYYEKDEKGKTNGKNSKETEFLLEIKLK